MGAAELPVLVYVEGIFIVSRLLFHIYRMLLIIIHVKDDPRVNKWQLNTVLMLMIQILFLKHPSIQTEIVFYSRSTSIINKQLQPAPMP